MNRVNTPWKIVGRFVFLLFGIPFIIIGIFEQSFIKSSAFLINGLIWFIVGMVLLLKSKYDEIKERSIFKEAIVYKCIVKNIFPKYMIKIGSYITARVQYSYNDGEDKTYMSAFYLLTPWDNLSNLKGKVYIDSRGRKVFVLYRNYE